MRIPNILLKSTPNPFQLSDRLLAGLHTLAGWASPGVDAYQEPPLIFLPLREDDIQF